MWITIIFQQGHMHMIDVIKLERNSSGCDDILILFFSLWESELIACLVLMLMTPSTVSMLIYLF